MAVFVVFSLLTGFYLVRYYIRKSNPFALRIGSLNAKQIAILEQYSLYYKLLTEKEQKRFRKRVKYFMQMKKFVPRGIEITEEMKVLVSATAIKLTFQLPNVYLTHFDRILIYPDDYYSNISKRYHKGEVNPRFGVIVLAWQYYLEGYIDRTDGINLGIHEMAHALKLENRIPNDEFGFFDPDAWYQWRKTIPEEMDKIAAGHAHLFRAYAATNAHEFFAIAIENFFERPCEFKEELAHVYDLVCRLLNQDTCQLYQKRLPQVAA